MNVAQISNLLVQIHMRIHIRNDFSENSFAANIMWLSNKRTVLFFISPKKKNFPAGYKTQFPCPIFEPEIQHLRLSNKLCVG